MTTWLREPLIHFVVLGGIVFGLYQWVGPKPTSATVITVDATVRREIIDKFRNATQREPTGKEMDELIEGWVTREVVYRQGLAAGLDRSDGRIREIVISNMHSLIRAQSVLDAPPEAELRQWFEARREQYDEPRRYDFVQVLFAADLPDAQASAQLASRVLASGGAPHGVEWQVRPYRNRTREQVTKAFGEAFAAKLEQQQPGEWRVVHSNQGWHAVRLDSIAQPRLADFAALKEQVENDWRREREFQLTAQTLRTMRSGYSVERLGEP